MREKSFVQYVQFIRERYTMIKIFTDPNPDCKHWYNEFLICLWCGYDAGASHDSEAIKREREQGEFSFEEPI